MVHSRWHWCFNAYLFVHESSDTRRTVSLLDLVVLFVLEMEGLSCSVPGRAPARSSDMLPSATSVLCLWWTGADLDCVPATHKQALTFPSCVLCLPWFEPPSTSVLKMQTDRFSLWKWSLVSFMMGLLCAHWAVYVSVWSWTCIQKCKLAPGQSIPLLQFLNGTIHLFC